MHCTDNMRDELLICSHIQLKAEFQEERIRHINLAKEEATVRVQLDTCSAQLKASEDSRTALKLTETSLEAARVDLSAELLVAKAASEVNERRAAE